LSGLFSVVCLIFAEHTRHHTIRLRRTQLYAKTEPTFSDAIAAARRLFWQENIFKKASYHKGFNMTALSSIPNIASFFVGSFS